MLPASHIWLDIRSPTVKLHAIVGKLLWNARPANNANRNFSLGQTWRGESLYARTADATRRFHSRL